MHARAIFEWQSLETRETRAARASPVSRLQSHGWSFACLERFARRTKKKERLLVVYWTDTKHKNLIPGDFAPTWQREQVKDRFLASPSWLLKLSDIPIGWSYTLLVYVHSDQRHFIEWTNTTCGAISLLKWNFFSDYCDQRLAEALCSHQTLARNVCPLSCWKKN